MWLILGDRIVRLASFLLSSSSGNEGLLPAAHIGEPLTGHTHYVTAVCTVPLADGRTLLATGSDEAVRLWDPALGRQVGKSLTGHTRGVIAVCTVPLADGRTLLATGSEDGTVRLWDPALARRVGEPLTGHTHYVNAVCGVPLADGRILLVTGSDDRAVLVWKPEAEFMRNKFENEVLTRID
jgi:WD40 repeat protein